MDSMFYAFATLFLISVTIELLIALGISILISRFILKKFVKKKNKYYYRKKNLLYAFIFYIVALICLTIFTDRFWGVLISFVILPIFSLIYFLILEIIDIFRLRR